MAESHEVIEIVAENAGPRSGSVKVDIESGDGVQDTFICKLCLDEIPHANKFTLQQCGCFFCTSCMDTYVEVLIRDGVVMSITCPDSECVIHGELEMNEINSLTRTDTFQKYIKLKYEQEVALDPHRTFCPNPACVSECHVPIPLEQDTKSKKKKHSNSVSAAQQPIKVSCQKSECGLDFCHLCKESWVDGHTCKDVSRKNKSEFGKLRNAVGLNKPSDAVIKRCPVCNILIEKDEGCAQMICKNCSHVFCWYCLKLLDNDFMLRHYDKGPCKDFLGHSRAQVFRHRMGVVGLFVAFSLLLIVVSPILLLALPVFLCCKWRECCQRALHRARQENNNSLYNIEPPSTTSAQKQNKVDMTVVSEVGAAGQSSSREKLAPDPQSGNLDENRVCEATTTTM